MAGTAQQSAAAAASRSRPASGPAVTIRSAPSAACVIACSNSTGKLGWRASSAAMSSPGSTGRPVTVETSRRRGVAKRVPASTLRSGPAEEAMAGECRAGAMPSTSAVTPSAAARLVSSRTSAVDPVSTWARGPS
jgi:hypothetical protein